MPRIVLLILAFVPLWGMAAEPASLGSIATGYAAANTYCDAGKRGWRTDYRVPGMPEQTFEQTFERCARRDGRFKYVETDKYSGLTANWSDGRQHYRYFKHGRVYQERSLDDVTLDVQYRDRSQIFPAFVLGLFAADPRDLLEGVRRTRYFEFFTRNTALSTPEYSVFERADTYGSDRILIRNADQSIARYERVRGDVVMRYVEITSRTLNRNLTDGDLRYDVPLYVRFSLSNNPKAFVAGLFVIAGLVGALVWGWAFACTDQIEYVTRKRWFLWRLQFWIFGVTGLLLAVLAAVSAGGSGHPPAIVYVFGMGIVAAVAFGLTACFTLASYPMQMWFKPERKSADNMRA
jgi:hypothetical protein